jgi:hypothetical protein
MTRNVSFTDDSATLYNVEPQAVPMTREQAIDEAVRRAIPIINTRRKRSRYNDKWPLKSAADLLTKRADNAYAQSFKPTVNGQYTKIIRAEYRRIAGAER